MAKDLFAPPSDDELKQSKAALFAAPTDEELGKKGFLDTEVPGGTIRGYIEGASDALPAGGAILGGGAGTVMGGPPGGLIGAGFGGATGKVAKNLVDRYILDKPVTREDVYAGPVQEAGKSMMGEGAGQIMGKGLEASAPLIKKGATKIASNLSGLSEDVLQNYAKDPSKVNKIISQYTNAEGKFSSPEATDDIRQGIQNQIKSFRQTQNQAISQGLEAHADKIVSVKPVIDYLEKAKASLDPELHTESVANIQNIIDKITKVAPDGAVSPKKAFEIQNFMRDQTSYKPDGSFFTDSSAEGRAIKGGAAQLRKGINVAAPEVAEANNNLAQLHTLENNLGSKNLTTPGKNDSALMAAGKGNNPRNAKNLSKLNDLVGGDDTLGQVQDVATAQQFANPAFFSQHTTGKALQGTMGAMGLMHAGGPLAHVAGGAMGLLSSPLAIKAGINAADAAGNAAPGLLDAANQVTSRAVGRKMTRGK